MGVLMVRGLMVRGFTVSWLKVLSAMVLVAVASGVEARMSADDFAVTINLAGKQRMLSQKMAKEALLIGAGVQTGESAAALSSTVSLFERTLAGLQRGDSELALVATSNPRIQQQLSRVETLWQGLAPIYQQIADQQSLSNEQLRQVAAGNVPLLKAMNKAVGMYERDALGGRRASGGKALQLNLAGRQRMLTQKMSKEFLLIAMGYQVDDNRLNLLDSISQFDDTLSGLVSGSELLQLSAATEPAIIKELQSVVEQWQRFMPLISPTSRYNSDAPSEDTVQRIAALNVPLLKQMNVAVKQYEIH